MKIGTCRGVFSLSSVIVAAILIITNTTLALAFNYTFESGFEQQEQDELKSAGNTWEVYFTDEVTMNIIFEPLVTNTNE